MHSHISTCLDLLSGWSSLWIYCVSKVVYWIVMVSLLFPFFQGFGQHLHGFFVTCFHHLPYHHFVADFSLTANAYHSVSWWDDQIFMPHSATMLGKFPTRWYPSDSSLVLSLTSLVIDCTEECTAYQGKNFLLLQYFLLLPKSPQLQLTFCFINRWHFPGT